MSKFTRLFIRIYLIFLGAFLMNNVFANTNEVRQSGNSYVWRINNVDQGTTSDLATAINNCIGTGNREIHILTGGILSSRINLRPGLTIYGHDNNFSKTHNGTGFYIEGAGPIAIYDLTLNNNTSFGIRTSRASNLTFQNITINGGGIGIRIDSHPSRPYEAGRWVNNVKVIDCRFENTGGHGLETYGVDGFEADGLVARNNGGCGVLLNKTINGTVGTVNAFRSSYGAGYAGLRLANNCSNVVIDMLYADECGRGFFVLSGSNNIHLNNCRITNCVDQWGTGRAIWLENVVNCSVKSGCNDSGTTVTGSGSYANVSNNCSINSGGDYFLMQNRHSNRCILVQDGSTSDNANIIQGDCNSSQWRQQWSLNDLGNGYFQIKNRHSGKCMRASGDNIVQFSCFDNYWTQMFTREEASNGYYIYINRHANKCLRVANSSSASGASIVLDNCNTSWYSQQFEQISLKSSALEDFVAESEDKTVKEIVISPNPVVTNLSISIPDNYEQAVVRIFDVSGKMVLNTLVTGGYSDLDFSMFKQGFYIVNLSGNDWSVNQKIIKE